MYTNPLTQMGVKLLQCAQTKQTKTDHAMQMSFHPLLVMDQHCQHPQSTRTITHISFNHTLNSFLWQINIILCNIVNVVIAELTQTYLFLDHAWHEDLVSQMPHKTNE
jgi:hypothetical protein